MTILMFPDDTVLINFTVINRMDLLERLANGNGQWCATVAIECAESAMRPELAALGSARQIFGEPLFAQHVALATPGTASRTAVTTGATRSGR